jgi:hypothetical protein
MPPTANNHHPAANLAEMEQFIATYRAHLKQLPRPDIDRREIPHLFRTDLSEDQHSDFLAWLFEPDRSHGRGDLFLRTFLGICQPKPQLPIPPKYSVQTRFWGGQSNIDILVYQPRELLLYIENKTEADEGKDQLYREFQDMRRLGQTSGTPVERQAAVYLTPDGRLPQSGREYAGEWHTAAYTDFSRAVATLLPQLSSSRLGLVLETWLDALPISPFGWRYVMNNFCETSVLLARNWAVVSDILKGAEQLKAENSAIVSDILKGVEQLKAELAGILSSVKADLKNLSWWQQGWQTWDKPYFHTSHKNWQQKNNLILVVSIGVRDFDIDHVFGPATSPNLFFSTLSGYEKLRGILLDRWRSQDDPEIRYEPDTAFPIVQDLPKCPADEQAICEYPNVAKQQTIAFFTKYATRLLEADSIIRHHMHSRQGHLPGQGVPGRS